MTVAGAGAADAICTQTAASERRLACSPGGGPNRKSSQPSCWTHVKLGEKLFLDVKPDPASEPDCSGLPWHMFFYVSQIEPTLRMGDLNDKWLEKLLKKNPSLLNHEVVDGDLVLTASTKQLQSFLLRHVNTKGAFTDAVDYARKK